MLPLLPLCMGGDFRIPAVFALFSYSAPGSACRFPAIPPGPGRRSAAFRRHISHPPHLYSFFVWIFKNSFYLCTRNGGLAQLARALAWHARGHEFESRILHISKIATAEHTFCRFLSALLRKNSFTVLVPPKTSLRSSQSFPPHKRHSHKNTGCGARNIRFYRPPRECFALRIPYSPQVGNPTDCRQMFAVFFCILCESNESPEQNRTQTRARNAWYGGSFRTSNALKHNRIRENAK